MGITHVNMEIANPGDLSRRETVRLLVDSGASISIVPAQILERIGIPPISDETFYLADGSTIKRKKGIAAFKLDERVGGGDVVFGEEGDALVCGVLTLEALSLALDPVKRELQPLPMLLVSLRERHSTDLH
jgi:predicted aspartyl protease